MKKSKRKKMIKTKLNAIIAQNSWKKELPQVKELSEKIVEHVINDKNPSWLQNKKVVINLSLSDDEEIKELNSEFRNLDKPTNVLSFANIDDEEFDHYLKQNQEIELGDVIIALTTMLNQSADQEITLHDHYCHILVHAVLHLLGYDHIEPEEAQEMESEEIRILKNFNIENPYQEKI